MDYNPVSRLQRVPRPPLFGQSIGTSGFASPIHYGSVWLRYIDIKEDVRVLPIYARDDTIERNGLRGIELARECVVREGRQAGQERHTKNQAQEFVMHIATATIHCRLQRASARPRL